MSSKNNIELETKLADFLEQFIKFEQNTEILRQNLYCNQNFSFLEIFSKLDEAKKSYITHNDISRFLREHKCFFTLPEICNFMAYHTPHGFTKFEKQDFEHFLAPSDRLASILFEQNLKKIDDFESQIADLLSEEIKNKNAISAWKENLLKSKDFSVINCFKTITEDKFEVNIDELLDFFILNNCLSITKENCSLFLNRYSLKGSNENPKIFDYSMLSHILLTPKIQFRESTKILSKIEQIYQTPGIDKTMGDFKENQILQKLQTPSTIATELKNSPNQTITQIMPEITGPFTIIKKQTDKAEICVSDELTATFSKNKFDLTNRKFPIKILPEFIEFIKMQIKSFQESEIARSELCLQADFTLIDGYSLFDPDFNGSFDFEQFYKGLLILGSKLKETDCYLFMMRRQKVSQNNTINYSIFVDLLRTKNAEILNLLKNRKPKYALELSSATRSKFKNALEKLIKTEEIRVSEAEKLRKNIRFEPKSVFDNLDYEKLGFLSYENVFCVSKMKNE